MGSSNLVVTDHPPKIIYPAPPFIQAAVTVTTYTKTTELDLILKAARVKTPKIDSQLYNRLGWAWGEDDTSFTEIPDIWGAWKDSGGAEAVNTGDFGLLQLGTGDTYYSDVKDTGDTDNKTLTITIDKYGSGTGSQGTIEWRGSSTSFAWDDASPSWETYTGSTAKTWRYVQVRLSK